MKAFRGKNTVKLLLKILLLLFRCWVVSDSLWLHGLQQASLSCPSFSPWVCSNSCSLSQWCHPIISFSVNLFSCPQPSPASRSFPMSWPFTSGGQSIVASAAASVLPMNTQELISFGIDWFYLLAVQGALKNLLQHHSLKASILQCSAFFMVQLWDSCMTTGKTIALTIWTLVSKVLFLDFNMLSRFVITFFLRRSCLQSLSTVVLGPKRIKSVTASTFSNVCYEVMRLWS